jgi:hypothetical protein
VLDSVNLERMGIPSVVVVGEQFVAAAKANARAMGMPDVSFVVLSQNDYLVEDDERVHAKLEPLVEQILERLFVAPRQG